MLRTSVSNLFGMDLPIFGAPMGGVAGPELVAAVSEAGGLGILGHANLEPEEVRRQIRLTKSRTDKPFGIGLLFPSRTEAPKHDAARHPLPAFLEKFVDAGDLAEVPAHSYSHDRAAQRLVIAIEQGVHVLALGLGAPASVVARAKAAGMKVIALVGSRRAAIEAESRQWFPGAIPASLPESSAMSLWNRGKGAKRRYCRCLRNGSVSLRWSYRQNAGALLKLEIGQPASALCSFTTSRQRAKSCGKWRVTLKGFCRTIAGD